MSSLRHDASVSLSLGHVLIGEYRVERLCLSATGRDKVRLSYRRKVAKCLVTVLVTRSSIQWYNVTHSVAYGWLSSDLCRAAVKE